MIFGDAIEALKDGERIRRSHWPQDEFLWLKEAAVIKESWCKDPQLKEIIRTYGTSSFNDIEKTIIGMPTICFHTKNMIKTGWFAECDDILADNWEIF